MLEEAVAEHPSHAALRVFLSLALRSAGREREAFQALGALVVDEVDLCGYDRATAFYLAHLD